MAQVSILSIKLTLAGGDSKQFAGMLLRRPGKAENLLQKIL
jgi:hypothetical protein